MTFNQQNPENCSCRGRMVTKDLYVCVSNHTWCEHQLQFGNGCFCMAQEKKSGEKPAVPLDTSREETQVPPGK